MALTPGTRLGVYEITAQIGEGGMGQVYRATDTKLKRQVAIKILPTSLAADHDRLARFQREAEVLASLNHPHIAAIYGLEDADGVKALVMELVDGDDLSQRIARGAIPLDEALPVAKQIAEALEAAHELGIIHRDLKPANIKLRPDGTVKVLDFGLAKAMEPAGTASKVSQSPTITTPAMMTGAGVILGTAAYMAPEQARGKTVDKRADIWAFGCVLYEMLTGTRAFAGDDVSEVLASVLARDPDWARLPSDLSPALGTYIRRCLHKDPKQRIADAQDIRLALEGAFETATPQTRAPVAQWRRTAFVCAVAGIVGGAIIGVPMWFFTRPAAQSRVSRLQVPISGTAAVTINGVDRDLAITPDGLRLIYVGNNGTQLFVRALDAPESTAVFTGAPRGPFVSPDGQWIGFADTGNTLRKVALTAGPADTLATLDGLPRGATWGPDNTIIVATDAVETGLQRVAAGGPATVLTRPDRAQGEADHFWPEFLPGGRAVLYTIMAVTGGLDAAQVAVLDLQTRKHHILVRGGSQAHYVPSGHIVYTAAGTLRAVPFDLGRLETRGTPVPVVPAVAAVTTRFGAVDAVVASDGTLAYLSGGVRSANAPRTLVWVDRQGGETPIAAPPRAYAVPRLSPDGTRVAVAAEDQERNLWLWDLSGGGLTRVTSDPGTDSSPVWMDDRRLLFSSNRGGQTALYVQSADGTGPAKRVTESTLRPQTPTAITADGTRVVFYELTATRGTDLRLLTLTPTPRVEGLLETPSEERNGIVSLNGHWLAYESNSGSGRFEIYVRPFPKGGGDTLVSLAGGIQPLWARSGRELFYIAPDGALMTVPVVESHGTLSLGTATRLVARRYFTGGANRGYDVARDGRFLMIKQNVGADQAAPASLIVVQHWDEELKGLVPLK